LPITKTAEREMRTAIRRRVRNKSAVSKTKTLVDKAEKAVISGNTEAAKEAVRLAVSSMDKDAEKGIIHANTASRKKARLLKKLNQAEKTAEA
jgi:small subunit ribosomal protein S20